MYNRAYALYQIGRKGEAQSELEQAQKIAVESSESRHRVITLALEQLEVRLYFGDQHMLCANLER